MIKQLGNSIRYPGGKNAHGHWEWIVSLMPTHTHYAEPFAGSAAIYRRKPPAMFSLLIELDPGVADWLKTMTRSSDRVSNDCGIRWLQVMRDQLTPEWLIYIDPPYLLSTRSAGRFYKHELEEADHRTLLQAIDRLDALVMLSGYDSPLYAKHLADWRREDRDVMTHGGIRRESLWMNFDPASEPMAGTKAGRTWRERQRIARKIARQRRIFASLPDYEQDALLAGLIEERRRRPRCR